MQKRIIDKRKKEKYMLDDEYLNGMARLCGWKGTIVYNSLCRHVDNEQQCFPSLELIAEQHGVSRPTVLNGIEELVKRNVIFVEKIRSKNGKWLNNSYTLIDKLEWDYSIKATKNKRGTNQKKVNGKFAQVNDTDTVTKSVRIHHQVNDTDTSQVNDTDTKETHKQGNTCKETHTSSEPSSHNENHSKSSFIEEVIKAFETVDAKNKTYYGNKTQRASANFLISEYGFKKVGEIIGILSKTNKIPFFPKINSPYDLKEKWQKLSDAIDTEKAKVKAKKSNVII